MQLKLTLLMGQLTFLNTIYVVLRNTKAEAAAVAAAVAGREQRALAGGCLGAEHWGSTLCK